MKARAHVRGAVRKNHCIARMTRVATGTCGTAVTHGDGNTRPQVVPAWIAGHFEWMLTPLARARLIVSAGLVLATLRRMAGPGI